MTKYRIAVTEITEYPETATWYEATDGKRYGSTYGIPEGAKYDRKDYKTGKMLTNEREVYSQDFDGGNLEAIIKAVNNIN